MGRHVLSHAVTEKENALCPVVQSGERGWREDDARTRAHMRRRWMITQVRSPAVIQKEPTAMGSRGGVVYGRLYRNLRFMMSSERARHRHTHARARTYTSTTHHIYSERKVESPVEERETERRRRAAPELLFSFPTVDTV